MQPLNATQLNNAQLISDYGVRNHFTDAQVELAVKVAFLESSLGMQMANPQPGVTAAGLFGYNNDGWSTHASLGDKNSTPHQIAAFFSDITTYTARFDNPVVKSSGLTLDQYIYVKHHDGTNYTDFVNSPGLRIFKQSDFNPDINHVVIPPGQVGLGGFGFDIFDPVYLSSHAEWFTTPNLDPVGTVQIGPLDLSAPGSDQD